jgi:FixJ family two-component response regulator
LPSARKTTVIVLDDDLSVCRALKLQLEILSFDVLVFHNAEELLAGEIPSEGVCLLADVYLAGMDGLLLCRHMSTHGSKIPTILMSGRDDQRTVRLMKEAKPVASIFKPFDQRTLLRAIRKAVRSGMKRRT